MQHPPTRTHNYTRHHTATIYNMKTVTNKQHQNIYDQSGHTYQSINHHFVRLLVHKNYVILPQLHLIINTL